MGLIKAAQTALGSTLADQWKEFFYCDALPVNVLVAKGQKRIGGKSSNKYGSDNIITNGSGIAVADGQAMIIVDQGKVVEFCAEPGEFTYDASSEPSIFSGNLGESILATFKTMGKRFTMGGDSGKDQRVYYFNTKEILDNKFGTPNPIPFRVVDTRANLDIDVAIRCSGIFTYMIADPIRFYTNICGNVEGNYTRDKLDSTLKTEFIAALQPAMAKLSALEIRPNQIITHNTDVENALNEALSQKWGEARGLKVCSVAFATVTLPDEDAQLIKDAQRTAMLKDASMAGATLVGAKADAMKIAAGNTAGAMTGFLGMGMAASQGGDDAAALYALGQQQAQANKAAANSWTCSCGATATGNFCPQCGLPKPAPVVGWTCLCGAVNQGKFCANCGSPKPAGAPLYQCDKCGWTPEDPANPPKFCPECGDVFDENDIKK